MQSDEILISQKQRNELQAQIEQLKMNIQIRNAEREQANQLEIEKKQKTIQELEADHQQKEQQANEKYTHLQNEKREMER